MGYQVLIVEKISSLLCPCGLNAGFRHRRVAASGDQIHQGIAAGAADGGGGDSPWLEQPQPRQLR